MDVNNNPKKIKSIVECALEAGLGCVWCGNYFGCQVENDIPPISDRYFCELCELEITDLYSHIKENHSCLTPNFDGWDGYHLTGKELYKRQKQNPFIHEFMEKLAKLDQRLTTEKRKKKRLQKKKKALESGKPVKTVKTRAKSEMANVERVD